MALDISKTYKEVFESLTPAKRELLSKYFRNGRVPDPEWRRKLAENMGISERSLRLRVSRIIEEANKKVNKAQATPTDFMVRESSTPWMAKPPGVPAPSLATAQVQRQSIANKSKQHETDKRALQHEIFVEVFRRINASLDGIEKNLNATFASLTSSNVSSRP